MAIHTLILCASLALAAGLLCPVALAQPATGAPAAQAAAVTALAQPGTGRIERIEYTAARQVAARFVDVWLPADYSPLKRYQVLYMHDGQNLFDDRLAFGGTSWRADAAVDRLVRAGRIADTLIVGIWNAGVDRYAEYFPEKCLASAPEAVRREYVEQASGGRSRADAYLRFIVTELKPAIDRRYATRPEPQASFIAGSSMGGLISIHALAEYPQVFGGAAGLSTHWVGKPTAWGLDRVRNAALPLALLGCLQRTLPPAGRHRIYTDRGDDALDALYAPAHQMAAEVLRDLGYTAADAATPVLPGTGHREADWAARLDAVLHFLMGPRR